LTNISFFLLELLANSIVHPRAVSSGRTCCDCEVQSVLCMYYSIVFVGYDLILLCWKHCCVINVYYYTYLYDWNKINSKH